MLVCDCPPCPLSPLSPVLAELQQADLITSEECEGTYTSSHVVRVQSGKSSEVQSKTADVLRRHGFEKESNLLSGKKTQPLIHVPTVEPGCKGHLKTSIIIVVRFAYPLTVCKPLQWLFVIVMQTFTQQ